MNVDLDQYRQPANAPETLTARRAALLHQLGWLADEAASLTSLLDELPAWALEQTALPEERSVKETLATLATLDRRVYPRWIERVVAEDEPVLAPEETARAVEANERPVEVLLQEVREARAGLVALLEKVPEVEWSRTAILEDATPTLYDLVLRIVRRDADDLRTLAYRLYEAKLTARP